MSRLIFLGCVAYLVVGLGQLVVGTVMEPMVHAYGVQYGDGGQLVMNQFLGGLVGIVAAPWLMRQIGKKALLLSALGLLTVVQFVYLSEPPWMVMLTIGPIAGFGFGTTEAVVGSFIIGAAGANANIAMSRVEVFFGVGALLMPFAGAALIKAGYWKSAFGLVGSLAVVSIILWTMFWPKVLDATLNGTEHSEEEKARTAPSRESNRKTLLLVLIPCSVFFAVYVGFEMSFVHYLPSVLVQDSGMTESAAALILSVYWGAMTLGRMVAGHAADRWGGAAYLIWMCVACAVFSLVMGVWQGATSTFVFTFLAGIAMSGMFAIALVFANRAAPGMTEKTTSMLMAFGGLGGALLPKLTGWYLDEFGASATRWLFAILSVVMLGIIVWAVLAAKRARSGTGASDYRQISVQ
ncbi:MFS transporter [Cohnella faecalis]|uniref:MFS transporter n=1 Tax=Cohnella faecalis TaxID=2315694 RepID=A0A398CH12_9BACL|nr:MFS transporter [Cohnella faecalis]RIE01252.1 MFS transporter [Cohnella faecalis]